MKFRGKVPFDNPILMVYESNTMYAWIESLRGNEVIISIEKVKVKKTQQQNKGLHVLINYFTDLLNQDTGNDLSPDDVKNIIKLKRNMLIEIRDKNGKFIGKKFRSFADLDMKETSDLIEWIYAFSATEFNITLPPLEKID